MKAIKRFTFLAVLAAFTACTDGPFAPWMDLTPPRGGWLWVAKNSNSSCIYKVDVSTGKWIDTLPAPIPADWLGSNQGLVFGDGKLWAGWADYSDDELDPTAEYYYCWIDPETGEFGSPVDISEFHLVPNGLAWCDSMLCVVGAGYCAFFEPYSGELLLGFWLTITGITGSAWDGSGLWVVKPKDSVSGSKGIYKLNPETGDEMYRIPVPCEGTAGLTWDGEALWVNDAKNAVVYRVSPETGTVLGYFAYDFAPSPWGLAWEFPSE